MTLFASKNIKQYTLEIINDELILTPKKIYITEYELNRTILTSSNILKCIVNNGEYIISTKLKYQSILYDIWISMATQKIIQTTTFNMKLTNENGLHGYKWCSNLNLSIQYTDAIHTFRDITYD